MFRPDLLAARSVQLAFATILSLFVITPSWAQNCTADAGTMTAYKDVECFPYDLIGGIPHGNAVVPAGFQTSYLLTQDAGLTILGTGNNTIFHVGAVGSYAVHTLVHDPNILDVSTVQPGTTTAFDIEALLIQGGGSICAALDLVGATIRVADRNPLSFDTNAEATVDPVIHVALYPNPLITQLPVSLEPINDLPIRTLPLNWWMRWGESAYPNQRYWINTARWHT